MKLISCITIALTLAATPLIVHAQDTVQPTASNVEKTPKNVPFRGTVSEVNASAGTFTIANKDKSKVRVYSLAKSVKLTRDDKDIAITDVKVGDYARGTGVKLEPTKFEVTTAKFGPKSAEEIAADKMKKEKKKEAAPAK